MLEHLEIVMQSLGKFRIMDVELDQIAVELLLYIFLLLVEHLLCKLLISIE